MRLKILYGVSCRFFFCGIECSVARVLKIKYAHMLRIRYTRMIRILEISGIRGMRRDKAR